MIRLVIFDLDGTLLDTRKDLANSINLVLKKLNKKALTTKEIISYVGNGIKNLVDLCVKPINDEEEKESLELFNKYYKNEFKKNTHPYKGIKRIVDEINNYGIIIGIDSNKDEVYTKELIKENFNNIDLNNVIGNNNNIEKKPSPQGIQKILDITSINKDEVLYIGDSKIDIQTAKNAKVKALFVSWGYTKKEDLIKEGAALIINKPRELLKYIKEENKYA